jgi:glycosyltransferase involved in cell wall biosynthesis
LTVPTRRPHPVSVVFVSPLYAPHIGGVERHVQEVSRRLASQGVSVSVITHKHDPAIPSWETLDGVDIIRFGDSVAEARRGLPLWVAAWWCLWKSRKLCRSASVLHFHDAGQLVTWWLPVCWAVRKRPFITFHGFDSYPVPPLLRWMRKLAEKLAKGHICVGRFLHSWYGTREDMVVYGGINPPPEALCSRTPEADFVYVGRLAEDTQVMDYIRAIQELHDQGRPYTLKVFGDGPLRSRVKACVQQHSAGASYCGPTSAPLEARSLGRYAFASGYLAILESLSLERLVFALYGNPLKKDYLETIPNARNMMLTAGSVCELQDKIQWAEDHPLEADAIRKAGQSWSARQTWERLVDIYYELWSRQ